ncbi:MAG: DUF1360 domain-containing protein [bacterium]
MSEQIMKFVFIALSISSITLTLTRAGIFKRPREWIEDRSSLLGELAKCPFCMSFWVSFGAVCFFGTPLMLVENSFGNAMISVFAFMGGASLGTGAIFRSLKVIG